MPAEVSAADASVAAFAFVAGTWYAAEVLDIDSAGHTSGGTAEDFGIVLEDLGSSQASLIDGIHTIYSTAESRENEMIKCYEKI